jgi:hypothetical protein
VIRAISRTTTARNLAVMKEHLRFNGAVATDPEPVVGNRCRTAPLSLRVVRARSPTAHGPSPALPPHRHRRPAKTWMDRLDAPYRHLPRGGRVRPPTSTRSATASSTRTVPWTRYRNRLRFCLRRRQWRRRVHRSLVVDSGQLDREFAMPGRWPAAPIPRSTPIAHPGTS